MLQLDFGAIRDSASVAAVLISVVSLKRSAKKDDAVGLEKMIDDRIQLKLGADIAVIKSELQTISKALSGNADLVRNTIDATQNAITETARELLRINPRS